MSLKNANRFFSALLAASIGLPVVAAAFPHGGVPSGVVTLNAMGMNLVEDTYYSTEYPFLNLVKQSGAGAFDNSSGSNQYLGSLGFDANGYPVSMTSNGTTVTTYHWLLVSLGSYVSAPPSGSPFYPTGTYRLKYIGQGTVGVSLDSTIDSGNTCSGSAGSVTLSNGTANTYTSCTFNVDTATSGLKLNITAITGAQTFTGSISTAGVLSVTSTLTWPLAAGNAITGSTLPTITVPSITAQLSGSTTGACSSGTPCTYQLNYSPSSAISSTTLTGNDAPRDISVVPESQASNYDAGAIFNPQFLAMLAPFSSLRFMDWNKTNSEYARALIMSYGGGVPSGATSITLSTYPGYNSGTLPFTAAVTTAGVMTASNTQDNNLQVGTVIALTGLTTGTYITALNTGTGGNGTYQLSTSPASAISAQSATSQNIVNITGSVSTAGVLTVTATSGVSIPTAWYVNLTGLPTAPAPYITSQLSGTTGGVGTYQLSYSPSSAISSTTGTITGDTQEPWTGTTGTYTYIFLDGEQRQVTLTEGSTTMSWTTALTNVIPANDTYQGNVNYLGGPGVLEEHGTLAGRSHASSMTWTDSFHWGVPIEVEVSLCNTLGASCWFNVPIGFSDSDVQALGAMIMNGTGMDSGFSGLGSSQYAYFERSNETWNTASSPYYGMWMLGYGLWGPSPAAGGGLTLSGEYLGYLTAHMAADLQTGAGSAFSRVIPTLGAQTAYNASFNSAMEAQDWSSGGINLTTYPIKAVNLTWYWGPSVGSNSGQLSVADCTTMTGQSDGGLADFFATMSSQTGSSGTVYSSVPTGGWYAQYQSWITAYQSEIAADYPSLSILGYEGGPAATASSPSGCSGWNTLVVDANRDSRSAAMVTSQAQWWASTVGTGPMHMLHYFNDVFPQTRSGSWGALESQMQWYANPSASVTPKYNGLYNYVHQ